MFSLSSELVLRVTKGGFTGDVVSAFLRNSCFWRLDSSCFDLLPSSLLFDRSWPSKLNVMVTLSPGWITGLLIVLQVSINAGIKQVYLGIFHLSLSSVRDLQLDVMSTMYTLNFDNSWFSITPRYEILSSSDPNFSNRHHIRKATL